jgi:uncharacterized RDD family membrane protein YckC
MNISKLFRRFLACCFDVIVVFGIYFVIIFFIKILSGNNGTTTLFKTTNTISLDLLKSYTHYIVLFYLFYGFLFLIYELCFLGSKLSATPGKLVLSLEVACYSGSNFKKLLIRSLLKVLAILVTPLSLLLFIASAFNKTKQSLYDKLTNTCVITKDNRKLRGANPHMTLEEFFEEMKSRGLRMYSEQKALSEEIYGSPIPLSQTYYKPVSFRSMFGLLVLVISIVVSVSFAFYIFPDIQKLYTLF